MSHNCVSCQIHIFIDNITPSNITSDTNRTTVAKKYQVMLSYVYRELRGFGVHYESGLLTCGWNFSKYVVIHVEVSL